MAPKRPPRPRQRTSSVPCSPCYQTICLREKTLMHKPIRTVFAVLGCVVVVGAGCRRTSTAEHVKRGTAFFDAARYPEAIVEFRVALQADSKLGDVRRKLADAYLKV